VKRKPALRALPEDAAALGGSLERFRYEARLDGRTIVVLRGLEVPAGGLAVETETFPAGQLTEEPPICRTFGFPTHEKARRFADEVLTALEYQNCVVTEPDPAEQL
jgi:hypothetical protein